MLTKRLMTWTLLCLAALISGCTQVHGGCGYINNYNCPYYGNSICGPQIEYRCDHVCDKCHAAEGECKICLMCIQNDTYNIHGKDSLW